MSDYEKSTKPVRAFLLSPLFAAALAFILVKLGASMLFSKPVDSTVQASESLGFESIMFGVVVLYVLAFVFVLPIYLGLVKRNKFNVVTITLVGAVAGGFSCAVMGSEALVALFGAFVGAITGVFFYRVHGPVILNSNKNLEHGPFGPGRS